MRVTALWRYPVKSVGGESLDHAEINGFGIVGDRHWAIRNNETGKFLTARREPKLLFASARYVDGTLDLHLPEGHTDLSTWLGYDVELIEAAPGVESTFENPLDVEREADWMEWQGPDGVFHDSKRNRISLLSEVSMGDWDLRRFRSNVIVDVGPEDELVGHAVRIGSCEFAFGKHIARCVMVTRPQPGIDRDLNVFKTINKERGGTLSVGATVTTPGTIAVGDEVAVLD